MPLYRCAVAEGLTREDQRARIAKEIVRIHCGVTGAPASFVHAFFSESPSGDLPDGKLAFVLGSIRSGRTDEQKRQIASELTDAVAEALGCKTDEVGVATVDRRGRRRDRGRPLQVDHGGRRAAAGARRRGRVAGAPPLAPPALARLATAHAAEERPVDLAVGEPLRLPRLARGAPREPRTTPNS
jgi:phenylpyruvate tautomerase PptA (4-oxalocrotonate tautomerase family)